MRTLMASVVTAAVLFSCGCGYNGSHGDGGTGTGEFYYEFSRWGDGQNWLIKRGSKLKKISIIGNHNMITIEDGVWAAKIEVVGNDNTFYYPRNFAVERSQIGHNYFRYLDEAPGMDLSGATEVRMGAESSPAPNAGAMQGSPERGDTPIP